MKEKLEEGVRTRVDHVQNQLLLQKAHKSGEAIAVAKIFIHERIYVHIIFLRLLYPNNPFIQMII
jgi:hypothetical protein